MWFEHWKAYNTRVSRASVAPAETSNTSYQELPKPNPNLALPRMYPSDVSTTGRLVTVVVSIETGQIYCSCGFCWHEGIAGSRRRRVVRGQNEEGKISGSVVVTWKNFCLFIEAFRPKKMWVFSGSTLTQKQRNYIRNRCLPSVYLRLHRTSAHVSNLLKHTTHNFDVCHKQFPSLLPVLCCSPFSQCSNVLRMQHVYKFIWFHHGKQHLLQLCFTKFNLIGC